MFQENLGICLLAIKLEQTLAAPNRPLPKGHRPLLSAVISLQSDIGWPPHFPILNLCDFFLGGYVKSKVYEHRPSTLEHLKAAITEEISVILQNMLEKMMVNF